MITASFPSIWYESEFAEGGCFLFYSLKSPLLNLYVKEIVLSGMKYLVLQNV